MQCKAEQFKLAMRRFPASVCVVATGRAPQRNGLTATAVCSLSAAPPQILVCLNSEAGTSKAILANQKFAVNVLRQYDFPIAQRFAGMGRELLSGEDRFREDPWEEGEHGVPVLTSAVLVLECSLGAHYAEATHNILIGRILKVSTGGEESALIYGDGRFGAWTPLHFAAEPKSVGT